MTHNCNRTVLDVNHVRGVIERVQFNASDAMHRLHAKAYLETGKWQTLQFLLEGHYTSIPDMIKDRMLAYYFSLDKFNVFEEKPAKATKPRAPRGYAAAKAK